MGAYYTLGQSLHRIPQLNESQPSDSAGLVKATGWCRKCTLLATRWLMRARKAFSVPDTDGVRKRWTLPLYDARPFG